MSTLNPENGFVSKILSLYNDDHILCREEGHGPLGWYHLRKALCPLVMGGSTSFPRHTPPQRREDIAQHDQQSLEHPVRTNAIVGDEFDEIKIIVLGEVFCGGDMQREREKRQYHRYKPFCSHSEREGCYSRSFGNGQKLPGQ